MKKTNYQREVDQLRVQLAGCSVAALGGTKNPAKKGDFGWSPAYQDVLNLRHKHDVALRMLTRIAPRGGFNMYVYKRCCVEQAKEILDTLDALEKKDPICLGDDFIEAKKAVLALVHAAGMEKR